MKKKSSDFSKFLPNPKESSRAEKKDCYFAITPFATSAKYM